MVALNHAIAVAMVHGPQAGLLRLESLEKDPRLGETHRLDAVRGHLWERAGDAERAVTHYRKAAALTLSTAERDYLLMRAAKLNS